MNANDLNNSCHCVSADQRHLHSQLSSRLSTTYEAPVGLFASAPLFIETTHIAQMQALVSTIESLSAHPVWSARACALAPSEEIPDFGLPSVFSAYDFHIGPRGPQLIEINTNAGGVLLGAHLAASQRPCCAAVSNMLSAPWRRATDLDSLEPRIVAMFHDAFARQFPGRQLKRIAIVDSAPEAQFLRPEFELFRELFSRYNLEAVIVDPAELQFTGTHLIAGRKPIDLLYNRLTDFYLQEASHRAIQAAWRSGAVALTPHPHRYAHTADKRVLTWLHEESFLDRVDAGGPDRLILAASAPQAVELSQDNAERLWKERREWFFKGVNGYGSKGAYRGAKLTRRVFNEMRRGGYIAQRLVPPGQRTVTNGNESTALKADVRCVVHDGRIQLLLGRLYQGQTTNLRTPAGGLAAVLPVPVAA